MMAAFNPIALVSGHFADSLVFAEGLFDAERMMMMLWGGLAILSLALLTLMLTRWGQARPLSKCVALSLFAHVLLGGYAYVTTIMVDPPQPPPEEVIHMRILEDRPEPQERREKKTPSNRRPKPWEQFADAAPTQPDTPQRRRLDAPAQADPQRTADFSEPAITGGPLADPVAAAEPDRPHPRQRGAPARQAEGSSVQPTPLTTSTPRRRADEGLVGPAPGNLRRRQTQTRQETASARIVSPELPSDLLDVASRVQQLAQTSPATQAAATTGIDDDLRRATNLDRAAKETRGPRQDDANHFAPHTHADRTAARETAVSQASRPKQGSPKWKILEAALRSPPRRLGDGQEIPTAFRFRVLGDRVAAAKHYGGNNRTEAAVRAALTWLASVQHADGFWDASHFGAGQETRVHGQDRGGVGLNADTGITGLALLAFLGAGHTHLEGEHRRHVQRGLEFLLFKQRHDGCLAGDASLFAVMYCHGMASLALGEALAMTGDHRLKTPVERAVGYTLSAQHPESGGWRYQPGDRGDTSQFGWQVMALVSAHHAGIPIPVAAQTGMRRFLGSVSSGAHGGLASYRPQERPSRTMTAEALLCRVFLNNFEDSPDNRSAGRTNSTGANEEAVQSILEEMPGQGRSNLYYWYYATLALHQMQGEAWGRWNEALQETLLKTQRGGASHTGSWDPDTVWGGYGGRVYTTALATLCLEAYYRYLPLQQTR